MSPVVSGCYLLSGCVTCCLGVSPVVSVCYLLFGCYLLSGCIGRVASALVVGAALKDHGSLCKVADGVVAGHREVLVFGWTARLTGRQDLIQH